MVYCAVVGCSSNNNKKSKDSSSNSKFRYFTFPSSKEICNTWVKNCCQKNKFNVQTARVCSRHFSEDDFQMKEKLLKLPFVKWKLKPDAIPSLNIPNPLNEQTSTQKIIDERIEENICVNIQGHDSLESESNREAIPMKMDNAGGTTVTETQSASTSRTTATQTTSSYKQTGLLEKIRALEEQNRSLAEQNRSLAQQLRKEKDERMSVEQIFTTGQLRKLKTKKQIHWGSDDVASAISLYAGGPRSYRLLKKRGYPLPSVHQ